MNTYWLRQHYRTLRVARKNKTTKTTENKIPTRWKFGFFEWQRPQFRPLPLTVETTYVTNHR